MMMMIMMMMMMTMMMMMLLLLPSVSLKRTVSCGTTASLDRNERNCTLRMSYVILIGGGEKKGKRN